MTTFHLSRAFSLLCMFGVPCSGQVVANLDMPNEPGSKTTTSVMVNSTPKTASTEPAWEQKFDRWVDVNDLTFALRYRSVFDLNNAHEFNQGQQRSIADGRFKFDPQGKYSVVVHASSGKYFNWAYADFEGGGNEKALNSEFMKATTAQQGQLFFIENVVNRAEYLASEQSGGWSFYVRRLYADLEPVKGVEVQYGSLDINRGRVVGDYDLR